MRLIERAFLILLSGAVFVAAALAGFASARAPDGGKASALERLLGDEPAEFGIFWEAWDLVEEHFDGSLPVRQRMTHAAIRGMLDSLGDPYTFFVPPINHELEQADLEGTFGGVGIEDPAGLAIQDGRVIVVSARTGSPAQRAGIGPGHILLRIDDRSTAQLSLEEAITLLRGPVGTAVDLTVRHPNQIDPYTVRLVREEIQKSTVSWRSIEPGIGYVELSFFSERTPEELRSALTQLRSASTERLVLDLRNNPGGSVDSAVEVASQFIADGTILIQRDAPGNQTTFEAAGGGLAVEMPLVVLVNRGTASSAEIVAAALRDHSRALLIGETTFGKGSVQSVHELSDGSSLHITIAHWLTPTGQQLQGVGIVPDVEIANSGHEDRQLEYALTTIRLAAPNSAAAHSYVELAAGKS